MAVIKFIPRSLLHTRRPTVVILSTITALHLQYRAIFDTAYKVNTNLHVCDASNGDVGILATLKQQLVVDCPP